MTVDSGGLTWPMVWPRMGGGNLGRRIITSVAENIEHHTYHTHPDWTERTKGSMNSNGFMLWWMGWQKLLTGFTSNENRFLAENKVKTADPKASNLLAIRSLPGVCRPSFQHASASRATSTPAAAVLPPCDTRKRPGLVVGSDSLWWPFGFAPTLFCQFSLWSSRTRPWPPPSGLSAPNPKPPTGRSTPLCSVLDNSRGNCCPPL
ncbi:hypothetical protein V8F06_002715 [Rhypophila decipiens]